jgi:predicted acylesterase/phospholipase RssA
MESAMANNIPALLGPKFQVNQNHSYKEQLKDMSRWIMANHKLQRDLVITASRLPSGDDLNKTLPSDQLPADLYFYFSKQANSFLVDRRFISFNDPANRSLLLDVVIGSSSIYPVFPPRRLTNVAMGNRAPHSAPIEATKTTEITLVENNPIAEQVKLYDMEVIDGGYIHNSPIDAALSWKPTHIILIEASPLELPIEPQNFMDSSSVAFNYLFNQAQRVDTQLKGRFVEIFELRPTRTCREIPAEDTSSCTPEPNLDTFDFSPNRVNDAILKGQREAGGTEAHFIRLPGPPQFKDVIDIITEAPRYKVYCIDGKIRVSTQSLSEIKLQYDMPKVSLLGEYEKLAEAQKFVSDKGGINAACEACQSASR